MNGFAGTNTAIPMWNSAADSQHPRETGREGVKGEGGTERLEREREFGAVLLYAARSVPVRL